MKVLTRKSLAMLKGGDEDSVGNQMRPRTGMFGMTAVGTNPMHQETGGWQENTTNP